MSKQHEPSSYDPQMSTLYSEMSQEQPEPWLDDKILAMAKRKIADDAHLSKQKNSVHWRRFQWPMSVAASALFVSLIVYRQFDGFDSVIHQPQSIPADPFHIADQSTLDAQQAASRQKLETKSLTLGSPEPKSQSILPGQEDVLAELSTAEPELSNYAEQEAQTLAASALDDVEIDPLVIAVDGAVELDTSLPMQGIDEQVAQEYAARQAISRNLVAAEKREIYEDRHEAEMIVATGSRIRSEQSLNNEYLDNLLSKYRMLESEKNSAGAAQRLTLQQSQQEIQQDILSYLSLLKAAEPDLEIDGRYLEFLSEQQKAQLLEAN